MPAVVVDSSVLISLAAGEQFPLLRTFYGTIYVPPEVWNEVSSGSKRILGVLLKGKAEHKIAALRPVLELMKRRTNFWLSPRVHEEILKHVGE